MLHLKDSLPYTEHSYVRWSSGPFVIRAGRIFFIKDPNRTHQTGGLFSMNLKCCKSTKTIYNSARKLSIYPEHSFIRFLHIQKIKN